MNVGNSFNFICKYFKYINLRVILKLQNSKKKSNFDNHSEYKICLREF